MVEFNSLLLLFVSYAISAIPLYLALHIVGSRSAGLLKVILVNILAALIISAIYSYFGAWAGLVGFIAVLYIYKEMFDIGWISAFLAWVLQFIVVGLLIFVLGLILGIALVL